MIISTTLMMDVYMFLIRRYFPAWISTFLTFLTYPIPTYFYWRYFTDEMIISFMLHRLRVYWEKDKTPKCSVYVINYFFLIFFSMNSFSEFRRNFALWNYMKKVMKFWNENQIWPAMQIHGRTPNTIPNEKKDLCYYFNVTWCIKEL